MKFYRIVNLLKFPVNALYARFYPVRYARKIGVNLGKNVMIYGSSYAMFSSEPYLVTLGDNVHITHALFVCHDGGVLPLRKKIPSLDITEPIKVGSNCFIGYNAIILPGITIGDDCIVGAGAVVSKDVPSGKIVVGNPARIVSTMEKYLDKAQEKSTGLGEYTGSRKKAKYKEYFNIKK